MTKRFESAYGYFSEDEKECNIVSQLTPRLRKNAIRYGDIGMMVVQTKSSYNLHRNVLMKCIARSFQDFIKDNGEKYFYFPAFIDLNRSAVKTMMRLGELNTSQFELGGAY